MSGKEFGEWMAYHSIEPFGLERIEIALAIGFASLINTWGGKVKPKDLLPNYDSESRALTPEQAEMAFRAMAEIQNVALRERDG